jgi:hypothetical protein
MTKPLLPATVQGLDLDKVRQALVESMANTTEAARELGVPARDLRALLRASAELMDQVFEVTEQKLDEAQSILYAGLRHEDMTVRLYSARFLLRYNSASLRRGWSRTRVTAKAHDYEREREPVTIEWLEPVAPGLQKQEIGEG